MCGAMCGAGCGGRGGGALESEHIYTHAGWQRPVFMQPKTQTVRFAATGVSAVQVSYDAPEVLRRGQGEWLPHDCVHDGAGGGCEQGITALRVQVSGDEGRLRVVQPAAPLIGAEVQG